MWERWYEAIMEEEKLQSNRDITVQCIDFCEATTSKVHAVLQHAPSDLLGGTFLQHPRVKEDPHLCPRIFHAAMFQVFEVHTYYSECWLSHGESGDTGAS